MPGVIKLTTKAISAMIIGATLQASGASSGLSPQGERAIREAENLSLLKDRLPACTALIRTIKKSDKTDQKLLKEKLNQLARYFYTDKGFQDFLEGKDLFEKQKFNDASEKFLEADDLENGNIEILNYLILTQVWLKQTTAAGATIKRALQIEPFEPEILRDELLLSLTLENWEEVLENSEILISQFGDSTPSTLQSRGMALFQTSSKTEGIKLMNRVATKDPAMPEPQYWLAVMTNSTKSISHYIELCEKKPPRFVMRDPATCTHVADAQKRLTTVAPVPTPTKDNL